MQIRLGHHNRLPRQEEVVQAALGVGRQGPPCTCAGGGPDQQSPRLLHGREREARLDWRVGGAARFRIAYWVLSILIKSLMYQSS